jgi:phosphatidylethanolamine/phosphatidyl-N-methylethanolamine N-methyltransferase
MKDTLFFFAQMARRWRTTGAIAPSSSALARVMVEAIGPVSPGQVILELGPGTGVFTRELLRQFPNNPILAVEVNDDFALRLTQELPGVKTIHGCASKLSEHLAKLNYRPTDVVSIVSGLPLLSLPKDLGQNILASITEVLQPTRRYVQFTYSAKAWKQFQLPGFQREPQKRVWLNLPPAFVLPFLRTESASHE